MEFQKLRLTGFKSFVEPTDFEIRPGLTGIVGPNGCGKSNLLEAMRWVMGATSAKALRAGGMEDVIFSGSGTQDRAGRPARSWAEVTLQMGNEDRTAPAEYNDHPMLEVTRRITKKNEGTSSSYKINGKDVRAKDVQLLFADAATGANSPALVRQGQVSDLINAKPENRRKFLEEAAGVTGLYARRHEAELRLKAASTNLERLEDVTGELEVQRGVLARQARQATRYRNIAGHLKRAEALLAYSRWQEAKEAVEAADQSFKEANEDLETAVRAAASANAERERQHDQVDPLRMKEADAAAALHRLTVEQENFERELDRAKGDIERLAQEKERLERELAREKDLGSDAAQALETLLMEEKDVLARQESEKERLTAAEADVQKASHLLEEAESAAEKLQKQVAEAEAEHRALTANETRARQALDRLTSEHTQAIGQKTAFDQEGSQQQDIQDRQDRLATLQHALEAAQQAVETTAAAKQEAMQKVEAAHPPRDEAMAKVNAIQAEIDTLTRILRESEVPGRAILEDMTVAEGYEAALAAALEDGLSASEDGEADQYWSPLGSARMKGSLALPEGAQPLSQYVTAPEVLTRRLQMIGVVTADQGQPLSQQLSPGQRLVTPEGDLWRWDGFVAKAGAKTAAAQRLAQKRELAARTEELEHAFENRDAAERLLGEAKVAVARLSEQEQSARTTADNARKAAETVERELNHLKAEEQKRDSRGEALTQRVIDLTGRLETAQQEMADAHQKLQQLGSVDNLQAALHDARHLRDEARTANGRARGIRAELRRDAEGREARLRQIKQDREGWARRQGAATERVETILKAREETHTALEAAEKIPSQLEERRESLYEAVEAAEGRRRVAADALAEVQTALNEAERLAKTADEAASLAREVKARTEAMGEAAKERLDDVKARAQEVNEGPAEDLLTLSEHDIEKDLPDQDILEEKIEKLKREREALGGVNLCADQEMQEIDTRLEEINKEKEDCEAAIAKLRGAISGLNRDGRQRLLEAFDKVNENFQDLFKQLFGGGEARLELVDSDDPLEAGLEIFASPPGKKLTSMSLMSGGEQALTATALIFAVFRSNPAPVCVLDEVDAPLDDANTDRFCAMLSKMAEETHTRFIAITHHPLTMSRMDRLYGVTMIERGVSQLVSVDLKDAEQMAA